MSGLRTHNIIKFRGHDCLPEDTQEQPEAAVEEVKTLEYCTDLTLGEFRTLGFIMEYLARHQKAPTVREIGMRLDHKSKGHTAYVIKCLRVKGYLEKKRRVTKWRGLRLTEKCHEIAS